MKPPSRKSCYNFRVTKIDKVLDGDTIDVTIDLGFDLYKKERVRIAGVDTPEKRTRDLEEKALGIDATNWMKGTLTDTVENSENELNWLCNNTLGTLDAIEKQARRMFEDLCQ